MTHQASLIAARHHWLEMTICFSWVHQSICILVILAGSPVKRHQGKVDGDDVNDCVGEHGFGDDLEIEGDALAAKRSHEDDDPSGGESDGTSGTLASTESDADVVPEKRRRQGVYNKSRPPTKHNPLAFS